MSYDIQFTQQEIQVLMAGLGELPLKISGNLYSKVQMAVIEADRKMAVTVEPSQEQVAAQ